MASYTRSSDRRYTGPALARTFSVVTTYREASVVVEVAHDEVSISRDAVDAPITAATLNGQPCEVERALSILRNANPNGVTLIAETLPPSIGAARARKMRHALSRAGYQGEHYALASGVLGFEVEDFPALTEAQARLVWVALTRGVAA